MNRAPSAKRGAVWLTIQAIAWLVSVGMLAFSIAQTNAHNIVPSVMVICFYGGFVIYFPVTVFMTARLAWRIKRGTTVR